MGMLPQTLRDLPPELESGLPSEMRFAEYRQLNRIMDFFTMFMSMFIPGCGLFRAEAPQLAWSIVGACVAGYAMMGSVFLFGGGSCQWNCRGGWRDACISHRQERAGSRPGW